MLLFMSVHAPACRCDAYWILGIEYAAIDLVLPEPSQTALGNCTFLKPPVAIVVGGFGEDLDPMITVVGKTEFNTACICPLAHFVHRFTVDPRYAGRADARSSPCPAERLSTLS